MSTPTPAPAPLTTQPPFSIHPLTTTDLPTAAAHLEAAKLRLSINRLLITSWPAPEFQKQLYTNAVTGALSSPDVTSLKLVDDSTGEMVGYLALTKRKASEPQSFDLPEGSYDGLNTDILPEVHRSTIFMQHLSCGFDHFDITYITIAPTHRNLGLGRAFIEKAFSIAQKEGWPIVLAAEPEAYEFFGKVGFKDTESYEIDLAKYAPKWSGFGVFRLMGMSWGV